MFPFFSYFILCDLKCFPRSTFHGYNKLSGKKTCTNGYGKQVLENFHTNDFFMKAIKIQNNISIVYMNYLNDGVRPP